MMLHLLTQSAVVLLFCGSIAKAETVCQEYGMNDLGSCDGCTGQLFISQDCNTGFYCANDLPNDQEDKDGCVLSCPSGQIILPDFVDNTWQCVEDDPTVANCFGGYHLRCPADALIGPLTADLCRCDNELLVSSNCRHGMFCTKSQAAGAFFKECPEGQVIDVDIRTWNWGCLEDVGQCPGLGGYELGCNDDSDIEVPLICSTYDMNPDCECEGQLFINEDCTEGFICTENIPQVQLDVRRMQSPDFF